MQHKRIRYLTPHACNNTKLSQSRGLKKGSKCITAPYGLVEGHRSEIDR